jgi:hypothetical protein
LDPYFTLRLKVAAENAKEMEEASKDNDDAGEQSFGAENLEETQQVKAQNQVEDDDDDDEGLC